MDINKNDLLQELNLIDSALHRILGFKPKLFSPPYGTQPSEAGLEVILDDRDMQNKRQSKRTLPNPHVTLRRWLMRIPTLVVTYNLDTKDKARDSSMYALGRFDQFITGSPAPGISLTRDLREANVEEVIGQAIDALRAGGYEIVNAQTCLGYNKRQQLYKEVPEDSSAPFPLIMRSGLRLIKLVETFSMSSPPHFVRMLELYLDYALLLSSVRLPHCELRFDTRI